MLGVQSRNFRKLDVVREADSNFTNIAKLEACQLVTIHNNGLRCTS